MKTALVTGGSRGIGTAIARKLGNNFHVSLAMLTQKKKLMM